MTLLLAVVATAFLVVGGCTFFGSNASDDAITGFPGECFNQPSGAKDTETFNGSHAVWNMMRRRSRQPHIPPPRERPIRQRMSSERS